MNEEIARQLLLRYIVIVEMEAGYQLQKTFIYSGQNSRGDYLTTIALDVEREVLESSLENFEYRLHSIQLSDKDPRWTAQKLRQVKEKTINVANDLPTLTPTVQDRLDKFKFENKNSMKLCSKEPTADVAGAVI